MELTVEFGLRVELRVELRAELGVRVLLGRAGGTGSMASYRVCIVISLRTSRRMPFC